MQTVVLDTTVLFSDPFLTSASGRLLLRKVKDRNVRLLIPEVVIRESARHYSENVTKSLEARYKSEANLFALGYVPQVKGAPPPRHRLRDDYDARFRKVLADAGAVVLPLPDVSHDQLLGRLFAERKPFKRDGEGYRDALIWESLLAALQPNDEVAFVTNNVNDFMQSNDRSQLHPDLKHDLQEVDPTIVLTPYLALKHLVQEITTRAEAAVADVEDLLRTKPNALASVVSEVERAISAQFPAGSELSLDEALVGPYENPSVGFIGDFSNVSVEDAREEPGGPVFVFLTAAGHISIDVFVFKADFYSLDLDEEQFMVIDSDWNDHYVFGSLERDLTVQVEATWEAEASKLTDVVVQDVDDAVVATLDPHNLL